MTEIDHNSDLDTTEIRGADIARAIEANTDADLTGLFSALREPLRLDLIEARRFPGGTAIHVYRPREGNR